MPDTQFDVDKLELEATIGFCGQVPSGLIVHPDRQHFIYPLGSTVIIEEISDEKGPRKRKQEFLTGHTNDVSCIAVSKSGRFLASGQITYMGFKADIIIWDFERRELYCRLVLHKNNVEALAFSPNDKYLVSLGGQDDGSVVVWSIDKKDAICGSPAQVKSAGTTTCICYSNNDDNVFVTGGDCTLRVWDLDLDNRKVRATDVNMGQLKRKIKCIQMKSDDSFFYCGTTTGDIISVNVKTKLYQFDGPPKDKFSLGVTALALLKTGEVLVGAGDGTVAVVKGEKLKRVQGKQQKVHGAVTSITLRGSGHQFFVGTDKSHIYRFNYSEFSHEMIGTRHSTAVNDIIFPPGASELFLTCGKEDIRVWQTDTCDELLRIKVPNMECHAICLAQDGKTLISAWDDGKIRAFYPKTGKEMFTIHDAHNKGVTAIACASHGHSIVSGGGEGQVRVWNIINGYGPKGPAITTKLVEAMKEHKGKVTAIKITTKDKECVSSSTDGTCIVWDLERFVRKQIMFANTLFKCVCYGAEECQMITSGTDRKICYWEIFDGSMIRELEGSKSGSVNAMDISREGNQFVTGGDDKLIKVWNYNEGEVTHVGIGHSGNITKIKICPASRFIVSVSTDGAILRWKFPQRNA
ncbi:cilia- and flagella-associated protein 52-like [Liolophura sinensis]|uniref:cilia- and flagella-associated protein 52-like n=1 Tax=Liolophura sinensis TaxID=3198878 RepID=UPI003158E8DF